jgi:D-amino-acid dehydrogenase
MRVAVIGAGVIGVTTAYELARDGHEVTVVDRRELPASETSHANAGMVAPGHAYAWSSPKALKTLLRALLRDDLALRFRVQADPRFWRWCWKFLRQCTSERAAYNTRRKVRLCLYSQEQLHRVVEETHVSYGGSQGGALYLYRDPEGLKRAAATAQVLRDEGVEVRMVSPDEAARLDPVYEPVRDRFAGALYAPGDESGDACLFTRNLAEVCRGRGVAFRMGEEVRAVETEGCRALRLVTDKGTVEADAFVLAAGCHSPRLGRMVGLDLPIYPVKGYSVTIPINGRNNPPTLSGVDEDNLFAFANYGDRVRLTAIAELGGYDTSHRPEDFTTLLRAARGLFPSAGDYQRPDFWAGLRPMTPDNLPIFGHGRTGNIWVNAGHGHMGWTWACGSARITADLIAGRKPEHDAASMMLH